MTFGRFLSYYADAPEIEKPAGKGQGARGKEARRPGTKEQGGARHKTEKGYERLFINLGKTDGFYPGELMQMLNRELGGRQQVGHIDLFAKFSYFEVPKQDARRVMQTLTGCTYKGRDVRCNAADSIQPAKKVANSIQQPAKKVEKKSKKRDFTDNSRGGTGDWRELMKPHKWDFKGDAPDFSEEGWAMRKPRKKKK